MRAASEKSEKKMKWKSDFDKSVVIDNFVEREWGRSNNDGEDLQFS